jgi:hypothetical protein
MVRSISREVGEAAFKGLQKQPETAPEASADAGEDLRSKVERLKELRMAKTTNDEVAEASEQPFDLFIFKSQSRQGLHAFTGDRAGEQLPQQFRPWRAQGTIDKDQDPPHGLSRPDIERSIRDDGFQLWRIRGQSAPKERK